MQEKIVITGATGVVGGMVLNRLRNEGRNVVGASRKEASEGWVRLDFERPETFDAAVAGVHTVMLIARPGDEHADTAGVTQPVAVRRIVVFNRKETP